MPDQNTPPVDPITGFWRDMWARATAQGAAMPGMPGMQFDPAMMAQAFQNPEAMRRMQAAFYDAMAQYAEQYMRTPQFLEAMKKSMDQALQLRQQMDGFLKSNMATAFESATGGSHAEILGAIRQSTAQLQSQIERLDRRVSDVEAHVTGKPKAEKANGSVKKSSKR